MKKKYEKWVEAYKKNINKTEGFYKPTTENIKSNPMKKEALKLADKLDGLNSCEPVIIKACEDMIRRLVEELDKRDADIATLLQEHTSMRARNERLEAELDKQGEPVACKHDVDDGACKECYEEATQTKLSNEEILEIWDKAVCLDFEDILAYTRAIEAKVRGEK
jgi:hypothetical protein